MSRSIASSTATNRQKYKIVFLGDQGAGKTSIINRFVKDNFDEHSGVLCQVIQPTVGIDFQVKNITHKGKNYRLQLWDTAGQERFRSLIPSYLKDALCAIIVTDVSRSNGNQSINDWIKLFNEHKMLNAVSIICSNKIDIAGDSSQIDQAAKYAKENNLHSFAVSAGTGENIQDMFMAITDLITRKQNSKGEEQIKPVVQPVYSPRFQEKKILEGLNKTDVKVEQKGNISLTSSQVGKAHREQAKCC